MIVSTSKVDAASRQCDIAIELLFANADPFAIRTLASAALGVFADLNDQRKPNSSWRHKLIDDSHLPAKEVVRVLHAAQNFLKHAKDDPDRWLTFDECENDLILFMATLECGELGHQLSFTMQTYQIWFMAVSDWLDLDREKVADCRKFFPGIENASRGEKLGKGAAFHKESAKALGLPRFS